MTGHWPSSLLHAFNGDGVEVHKQAKKARPISSHLITKQVRSVK